jgi:nucleotidyltransferase/DNA polymerase involved in DNA repair
VTGSREPLFTHTRYSITAYCEEHNIGPDECVEEMRRRVFDHTKLTVSAGIAPNKVKSFRLLS